MDACEPANYQTPLTAPARKRSAAVGVTLMPTIGPMRRNVPLALLLTLSALGVVITSCGDGGRDCLPFPCPLPLAGILDVTAGATGGPVNGAVVKVSGAVVTTVPCSLTCYLHGYAGTYTLDVEAPGFQSAHRTITVQGTTPACGCPTTVTEHFKIALASSPGARFSGGRRQLNHDWR